MHRFFTGRLSAGDSRTLIYTELSCYCTNCSIGNLAQCRWQLTHVPSLKEIDLGFSMEAGTGDMYLRCQLSRKKRQLTKGNISIVRTQPSEYNGIELLPFTVHRKDTIQWNARHHSSYGGIFRAGDEIVFVTEDFEVLSSSFIDGVATIHMSRTDKDTQQGPWVVPLQAIIIPDFTDIDHNHLDNTITILPGQYQRFTSESNRQSLGGIPARFSRQLRLGDTSDARFG
ncbi:unnamed protein product [Choristocarpus tenellus]